MASGSNDWVVQHQGVCALDCRVEGSLQLVPRL